MTTRERFAEIVRFGNPDRPPLVEMTFWPETLERWHGEGLPLDADIYAFAGLDPQFQSWGVKVDFYPIPRSVERVLEETDRHVIYVDKVGAVLKQMKTGQKTIPQSLDYPVKDRPTWDLYRQRMDPRDPRRYPLTWGQELFDYLRGGGYPLPLGINTSTGGTASFFGWLRHFMGTERLLYLFYDDPGLIHDMNEFYEQFTIDALGPAVESVRFDFVNFWEDMAYNHASLISPKMFRDFMLPHYRKVTGYLRDHGVGTMMVDCDGNIDELIPLWLEGGVNFVYPLEVAAGMDAVKLRKKYGRDLVMMGNIDKRVFPRGKRAIRDEVMSKVPWLVEQGGYIPCFDHAVPPDVSLENYLYYLDLLKEIYGVR